MVFIETVWSIHWCQTGSSVTFSILSIGQSEGLYLQRNQLDPQLRRHQKQILRLALEALSVGCREHLLMSHQTRVSLVWDIEDLTQLYFQFFLVIIPNISLCSLFCLFFLLLSGLTGTSFADRQRRHMNLHAGDIEKFLFLKKKIQSTLNSEIPAC